MTEIDSTYEIYRFAKRLIERAEACCEKDHSGELLFKDLEEVIKTFDSLGQGYAERYEKEKQDAAV